MFPPVHSLHLPSASICSLVYAYGSSFAGSLPRTHLLCSSAGTHLCLSTAVSLLTPVFSAESLMGTQTQWSPLGRIQHTQCAGKGWSSLWLGWILLPSNSCTRWSFRESLATRILSLAEQVGCRHHPEHACSAPLQGPTCICRQLSSPNTHVFNWVLRARLLLPSS